MPDDYYFIAFKLHAYTETAPLHSLRTWKWTKYCLLLMLRLESQASSKTFKVINLPFWPELFYLAISLGINTFWIPFIPWNSSFPKMPPIPPTYPHCMQKRTFLHVLVVVAVTYHCQQLVGANMWFYPKLHVSIDGDYFVQCGKQTTR